MDLFARKSVAVAALIATSVLGACSSDDNDNGGGGCSADPTAPGCQPAAAEITADITQNTTWRANTVYTLKGFIKVQPGATLTIEPGTRIVGDYNTPGSSLFILPGAKIEARGTAQAPIVFTSSQAVGSRRPGDWGGLILVGKGVVNRGSTTVPVILEGTGTGPTNPEVNYAGGGDNADNSGVLSHVRVEFAGYATAPDAELNAFTFAAVGSGTQLDHLQVLAGLDDSFEWFGGAVDARYLVSYEAGDDHFDMSEGYQGRLQYLIAYQSDTRLAPRPAAGSPSTDPQGIENDGCHGSSCNGGNDATPLTTPVVANFTLVGTGPGVVDATSGGIGAVLRRGTGGYYVNGILARWPKAAISIRDNSTLARLGTGDLLVRNHYLVENGANFDNANTIDLVANGLEVAAAGTTAASIFTALPATPASAADLDWSLKAGVAPTTGGLSSFTGALASKAGTAVTATAFRGAADPAGAKWWSGWTSYARN